MTLSSYLVEDSISKISMTLVLAASLISAVLISWSIVWIYFLN